MYLSKIHIKGFRNFKDHKIVFNDGINVLIGHNNAGKSDVLRALSLVIDVANNKNVKALNGKSFVLMSLKCLKGYEETLHLMSNHKKCGTFKSIN